MKFRKINSENETIEFLVFNFDGQGSALVIENDSDSIDIKTSEEVKDIILGKKCKDKEYKLI